MSVPPADAIRIGQLIAGMRRFDTAGEGFEALHEQTRQQYQRFLDQFELFPGGTTIENLEAEFSKNDGQEGMGIFDFFVLEESELFRKEAGINRLISFYPDDQQPQIIQEFLYSLDKQRDLFKDTRQWVNDADKKLTTIIEELNVAALQPLPNTEVVLPPTVLDQAVLGHPLHGCVGACSVCRIPNRNNQLLRVKCEGSTSGCGHVFCRHCIKSYFTQNPTNPRNCFQCMCGIEYFVSIPYTPEWQEKLKAIYGPSYDEDMELYRDVAFGRKRGNQIKSINKIIKYLLKLNI
jgi:hypothetical protein